MLFHDFSLMRGFKVLLCEGIATRFQKGCSLSFAQHKAICSLNQMF